MNISNESTQFFSFAFIVFSAWAILGNYVYIFQWYIKRKHSSQIPFIGGILGSIGLVISPVNSLNQYWWIPLFLDPGCVCLLVATIVYWGFRHNKK